jgi:hypothetical protein
MEDIEATFRQSELTQLGRYLFLCILFDNTSNDVNMDEGTYIEIESATLSGSLLCDGTVRFIGE